MRSTIDSLAEDRLTAFAIRLALAGHRGIPREGEFDFLAEAESVFTQPVHTEDAKPKKAQKPVVSNPKPIQKAQAKKRKRPKKDIAA